MRSHMSVIARTLQISSTNRMPEFRKKDMRSTTLGNASPETRPDAITASRTSIAVAKANAISCTGVAPASCRW